MRIVHITDTHLDLEDRHPYGVDVWANLEWALSTIVDSAADLIVHTGDLALSSGSGELYRVIAEHFVRVGIPYLLIPGNHDAPEEFEGAFGRRYRVTDQNKYLDRVWEVGGVTMLALDTAAAEYSPEQMAWLESVLTDLAGAASRGLRPRELLLWIHHPILTGFHQYMDARYALKNAQQLERLVASFTGLLKPTVYCGHYHTAASTNRSGIRQQCTPSTYTQIDAAASEFKALPEGPAIRVIDYSIGTQPHSVIVRGDT